MFKKLLAITLLAALCLPAAAQGSKDRDKTTERDLQSAEAKRKAAQGVEFDFVDSENAYWVNKGLNDTIFQAGQSYNSVHDERGQSRSEEAVRKSFKPATVADLDVQGRKAPPATPTLLLNGKRVDVQK